MNKNEHLTVTYIPTDLIDTEDQPVPELLSEEYDGLKQSIATIGLGEPVKVVLKSDGRYRVLDGRNRLKATKELGHTEIPCIIKNIKADYRGFFTTYDLELFRRRLSDEDHKRILTERNRLLRKWTQQAFEDCLQRIIPELHKDIKQLFEETKDPDTVVHLSLIPEHLQKAFYKEVYVSTTEKEAEQKLAESLQKQKEYESERTKLVEEINRLSQYQPRYEKLEEEHKTLLSLTQKKVEEEIKKREAKIREQYQTETPQQIQKLLSEERKRVETEYQKEIETQQKELREMSWSRAEVQKQVDAKQEEIDKTTENLNHYKNLSGRYQHDVERFKDHIKTATSPQKIPRRILATREDLNSIYQSLLMIGVTAVMDKKQIVSEMEQIKKVLADIEKFLNEATDS